MTIVPIAIFWSVLLLALVRRGPLLLSLFFCSMAFDSLAVLPPAMTGGLTLTPAPMVALCLALRTFGSSDGLRRLLALALRPDRLALLSGFWIVAVYATIFMPRLFAGEIMVVPFRGADLSATQALAPTPQNVSQLGYLTISVLTVFAFADLLRDPATRAQSVKGLVFGGGFVVATGFLDYASQFLPLDPLLAPFRTATYALVTDTVVLGGKRVVGLMPEASAFGGLALSFLMLITFLRRTIDDRTVRDVVAPVILVCLGVLIYLAKSTSAYVGLALFIVLVAIDAASRYRRAGARDRRAAKTEFWAVYLVALVVLLATLLKPDLLDPVYRMAERMVFEKASSESFEERGLWRSTAWDALWSSYGLGIGVGGTRSSSETAGIFAATGLLGGLLFYGFVLRILTRSAGNGNDEVGRQIVNAVRLTYIPGFAVSYFVGSSDFGAFDAYLFGLIIATAAAARSPAVQSRPARNAGAVKEPEQARRRDPQTPGASP